MKTVHVALVCENQENSDRFYADLLGLEKTAAKEAPAELMQRLFGVNSPYTILYYAKDACHLEIFIGPRPSTEQPGVAHLCLDVGKRGPFLERCRKLGVEVIEVARQDGRTLVFIRDFDGNRFEIKGD